MVSGKVELEEKLCGSCEVTKPIEKFARNVRTKDGRQSWCRDCTAGYNKDWKIKNPDKEEVRRKHGIAQRTVARQEVLTHYGAVCACCGESHCKFLTIDHIYGGGNKHRRMIGKSSINIWLVQNNFPEGYQLLCYNCNCGKYHNDGVCPHEEIE
jgi:hypothetical protein